MFDYIQKLHIFRRFLLSYILILVIPLFASFIVYQISLNKLIENATINSENLLRDMTSTIDQKHIEIEKFVYQLHLNQDVSQLMHRKSRDDRLVPYDIYKVRESIDHYTNTNSLFTRFYIYFNQVDTIVTPQSAYVRPEDFFSNYTYNEMSFDEWNDRINKQYYSQHYLPATKVTMDREHHQTESMITYVKSLPLNQTRSSKANLVIMINESEFNSLLNPISSQYNGFTFVYDQFGTVIFSDNVNEKVNIKKDSSGKPFIDHEDEEFMQIELKSKQNDWTYVAAIPKDKLLEDVNHIKTINMLIAFITILVGLCIAFLFSYKNSIPLSRLLGVIPLSDSKEIKNPYEFLHSNVEDIIANNTNLKDQIHKQQPILQASVLRSVVTGEWTSVKDVKLLMEQANIHLKGNLGYVGIIQLIHFVNDLDKEMLEEMNVARLMIQNELETKFNSNIYLFNFDVDQLIFLLTFSEKDSMSKDKKIEEELTLFIQQLKEQYQLQVKIGLSHQFQDSKEISKAYEEAKSSLPFVLSVDQQATLYKYNKVQGQMTEYYYPIELELRLINSVMNGDENGVKDIFEKIYDENVEQRRLTQQNGAQLISSLHETIIRIFSKNTQFNYVMMEDIQKLTEEMRAKKSIFCKDINQMRWIMIDIAQRIQKKKFAGDRVVVHKIKAFIKQNFHDPDLTLFKVADAVSYPEKRVPVIFKEHFGINISDFIEEVRINYAKLKLTQSSDSIEDISISSGYNSGHSFRRAFKRNTGLSPSEYRKAVDNL